MHKIYLIVVLLTLTSCSSYKVKNLEEDVKRITYNQVIFIDNLDNFPSAKKVSDFNVTDLKKNWNEIKTGLIDLAKTNHANAIVASKFELAGKQIKGKLYQVSSGEINDSRQIEKTRIVYLFRDELGSILTTHFKTEIKIAESIEKLEDRVFKTLELDENQGSLVISINGNEKKLNLKKGDNYFWISRQINANHYGNTGVSIEIGGQKILRIEDNDRGKIWVSTLKNKI